MGLMISLWSVLAVTAAIVAAFRVGSGLGRKLNTASVTSVPEGYASVMAIKKEFLATIRNSLSIPTC